MLFNSFSYFLFLPIVVFLYYLLPYKLRWMLLLAASCFFYMFFIPQYILILGVTITIDFITGIMLEKVGAEKKKLFLVMSIVANVTILAFFKYYNFLVGSTNDFLHLLHVHSNFRYLDIVLPIGLSFHTFQAMSYTIEVYRGNQKAERHYGMFALYILFFSQLVAGPIERPQKLLHQFREEHKLDYDNIAWGLRLILWGFIKKVVIADRLTFMVDRIYRHPQSYSGCSLALGTIFFAFQIYCDFSGYTDMAIGSARILGFRLSPNFNFPYHARSIVEFWKRWHISLSSWFRDYLYIPMGGKRVSLFRWLFNILVVFIVSGLWHGANATFIFWGLLHGIFYIISTKTDEARNKISEKIGLKKLPWLNNGICVVATFALVTYAWSFFRANSVGDALYISKKLFIIPMELKKIIVTRNIYLITPPKIANYFIEGLPLIIGLELAGWLGIRYNLKETFSARPAIVRWSLYYLGLVIVAYFGIFQRHQFIYFQF